LNHHNRQVLRTSNSNTIMSVDLHGDPDEVMSLRVKASSFKDCELSLAKTASIKVVKQTILDTLGEEAKGRYLRLICKGRLLAPDTATLDGFKLKSGDVLHAVLAAQGVR
jgi:hypothetical protein